MKLWSELIYGTKKKSLLLMAWNLGYSGGFDATCRPCTLDYIHDSGSVLLKCNCLDQVRFPRYTALEMGPGGKIALFMGLVKKAGY